MTAAMDVPGGSRAGPGCQDSPRSSVARNDCDGPIGPADGRKNLEISLDLNLT
jgi:hypothetical protein